MTSVSEFVLQRIKKKKNLFSFFFWGGGGGGVTKNPNLKKATLFLSGVGKGDRRGARVSEFFTKILNKKKMFFSGRGGGRTSVRDFFYKEPSGGS